MSFFNRSQNILLLESNVLPWMLMLLAFWIFGETLYFVIEKEESLYKFRISGYYLHIDFLALI